MNINEALVALKALQDNPQGMTLSDLENIVDQISIDDNTAPKGATTHLYTTMKGETGFINDEIRILDHTDAAQFLMKQEYLDAVELVIEANLKPGQDLTTEVKNYLYGGQTNGTTGPWAEISRRFAADTKGNVVCHIGDINEAATRTWWNVEIPTNNTDVNFINRAIIAYGDDGNILKVDVTGTGTGTGDLPEGCTALGYAGSVDSNIKHNL